jgi:hypothetical protein
MARIAGLHPLSCSIRHGNRHEKVRQVSFVTDGLDWWLVADGGEARRCSSTEKLVHNQW